MGVANDDKFCPAELVKFDVSFVLAKNYINWETASELNTYRFYVLRSHLLGPGIKKYEIIDSSDAKGNSNVNQSYTLIDSNLIPATKNYFYKLLIVDKDGSATESNERYVTVPDLIFLEGLDFIVFSPETGKVRIAWGTLFENDIDSFFVSKRILNDKDSVILVKVIAEGFSDSAKIYGWYEDFDIIAGVTYVYDLYAKFKSGYISFISEKTLSTTNIDENEHHSSSDFSFTTFPNGTFIDVIFKNPTGMQEYSNIQIFDIFGNSIYSDMILINQINKIDVSNFAFGVYFIKIGNQVKRFLKE